MNVHCNESLRPLYIVSRVNNKIIFIPLHTVYFFKADSKYVTVFHEKGESIINLTLKLLSEKLPSDLVSVHRSTLVVRNRMKNVSYCHSCSRYELSLSGCKEVVAVSRRYKLATKQLIHDIKNSDQVHNLNDFLFSKKRNNLIVTREEKSFHNVKCIHSEDKYLWIHHRDGKTLYNGTLKWFEREYSNLFLRAAKNALIVPEYVDGLIKYKNGSYRIVFDNLDVDLLVSRGELKNVMKHFLENSLA